MSSHEKLDSPHRDHFGYLSQPIPYHNRMATDVHLPPECKLLARIIVEQSEDVSFEEMDVYCKKVQQQLEEDFKLGRKREIIY